MNELNNREHLALTLAIISYLQTNNPDTDVSDNIARRAEAINEKLNGPRPTDETAGSTGEGSEQAGSAESKNQ